MDWDCVKISLGGNCAPTYHLDRLGLRTFAYPFDWAKIALNQLIQVLENDFVGYSNVSINKFSPAHSSFLLENPYGVKFAHEVLEEKSVEEFSKSLDKRIERFGNLQTHSFVKFYRIEMGVINPPQYIKSILKLIDLLAKYSNNFVLRILIHKDQIMDLEGLDDNLRIIVQPFVSYSEDWQMNHIDWIKVLN